MRFIPGIRNNLDCKSLFCLPLVSLQTCGLWLWSWHKHHYRFISVGLSNHFFTRFIASEKYLDFEFRPNIHYVTHSDICNPDEFQRLLFLKNGICCIELEKFMISLLGCEVPPFYVTWCDFETAWGSCELASGFCWAVSEDKTTPWRGLDFLNFLSARTIQHAVNFTKPI